MQKIINFIQKKPKTSGKGLKVLVNAAARDAVVIAHKQGLIEKPTKDDKKQLETIGKTIEAAIDYTFSKQTSDNNQRITPEKQIIIDISDIIQNDVPEVIKDFKELVAYQEETTKQTNSIKIDLSTLDIGYKNYLDTQSILPHKASPKHTPLKTVRFVGEKIFQTVSNNQIDITYNNVQNVHIVMIKGEINIAVENKQHKNGYEYILFDKQKCADLTPLSHKEVMNLQETKKQTKKVAMLLKHPPNLTRHNRSKSSDSIASLSLTEVSESEGSLPKVKKNDSKPQSSKNDNISKFFFNPIVSDALNTVTDALSDVAVNYITGQEQALPVKIALLPVKIVTEISTKLNETYSFIKDMPSVTLEYFDPQIGVCDINTDLNENHTKVGIVGDMAGFLAHKFATKGLPQDVKDKRTQIARTLPAALAEYGQTQTITPNSDGHYTQGQEMVLLAINSQDRLMTKIKEAQIDSKVGQALDYVGVNHPDIKTVQKITQTIMQETINNLPNAVYKKSLLTVVQKSLNLGIEKGISIKTKLCDNPTVKLQDNILHIAVTDTTSKKGYKYIPVQDLNEDTMFPLSNKNIKDFSLINDMQPILKDTLNEVHDYYPLSRIKNPKNKKDIKKAKIRDTQIQEQKQKRYDNYMKNINQKIMSNKDTTNNITYLQYISKVTTDAGQILIGHTPEANSKTL